MVSDTGPCSGEPSLIRVILGEPTRLLTTLATHVRELEPSEKPTFRQLSSPVPVLEVSVNCTPGTGSSEGGGEYHNIYTHVLQKLP